MVLINLNNQDMEIKYTVNEICTLEEKTGKGLMALIAQDNMGFNIIRLLLWAGLKHKQQHLIPETVGNWLQIYLNNKNSLVEVMDKITKALKESGVLGDSEDNENNNSNIVGEINPT